MTDRGDSSWSDGPKGVTVATLLLVAVALLVWWLAPGVTP